MSVDAVTAVQAAAAEERAAALDAAAAEERAAAEREVAVELATGRAASWAEREREMERLEDVVEAKAGERMEAVQARAPTCTASVQPSPHPHPIISQSELARALGRQRQGLASDIRQPQSYAPPRTRPRPVSLPDCKRGA